MNTQSLLTKDGINKIRSIASKNKDEIGSKASFNFDKITFQVGSIVQKMQRNFNVYTIYLVDQNSEEERFVFFSKDQINIAKGDIISVSSIEVHTLRNLKKVIFLSDWKKEDVKLSNEATNKQLSIQSKEKNTSKKSIAKNDTSLNDTLDTSNVRDSLSSPPEGEEKSAEEPVNVSDERRIINKDVFTDFWPLSFLTTFSNHSVKCLVKLVTKRGVKTYTNRRTKETEKLVSFVLRDFEGTEMDGVMYGDADTFNENHPEGKIYVISMFTVLINDKKFALTKSDYRLSFSDSSVMEEIDGFEDKFKEPEIALTKISDLNNTTIGSLVNVAGIVIDCEEKQLITTRSGEDINRRILVIGDETKTKVVVTLWREKADLKIETGKIYIFKNMKSAEFNGEKKLTSTFTTEVLYDNKLEKTNSLRDLLANGPQAANSYSSITSPSRSSLSKFPQEFIYIKELEKEASALNDGENMYFKVRGECKIFFNDKEKMYYEGCLFCKKKLIPDPQVGFWCEKCKKEFTSPEYYFTIAGVLMDPSGEIHIKLFGDQAKKLIGVDAKTFKEIIQSNNRSRLRELEKNTFFKKCTFYIRASNSFYNDTQSKKFLVIKFDEYKYEKESREILASLKQTLFEKRNLKEIVGISS